MYQKAMANKHGTSDCELSIQKRDLDWPCMKSLNAWHAKALAMRINNEINQIQPPIDLILIKYLFIDEA